MRQVAQRNDSASFAVQAGMTGRKLWALAITAIGMMVVVPVAVLLLVGPQPPPADATPSSSPLASETVVVPAVGDIAWVFAPPPGAGMAVESYGLQAGTLDVDQPLVDLEVEWHADLGTDLGRQPAVGPPTGGAVVYVADDGVASAVHRARIAADGHDEILAQFDEVVWDMAVAPDGQVAYAALVERGDTEHDLGVVRIALDDSGEMEPVMPPAQLAADGAITRVAFISFNVELALSVDGRHLVRRSCVGSEGCVLEVLDLTTGVTRQVPEGEVLGGASGVIVMHRCGVDGCRLEATHLDTGATLPIDGDPQGRVTLVGGNPVFVGVSRGPQERTSVVATDLKTGLRSDLYRTPDGANAGIDVHLFLVLELPAGHVHVSESVPIGEDGAIVNVRFRELLISIPDGHQIEMPPAPFRPPPGWGTQG
jgi:hypothetical protein